MLLFQGLLLIGFLGLSAFFSGIETAFMSLSQLKVRALRDQKKKGSEMLFKLKKNQKRLIITVLIGNNFVNVGASAYSAVVLTQSFGNAGIGIATAIMTLLILTFGEILPKTYFARNAERLALLFSGLIYSLEIILFPLVFIFERLSNLVAPDNHSPVTEREIKTMIEMGAEDDVLHEKQEELMQSVFEFDDTISKEIMTPRVEMFALDETSKLKTVMKEIKVLGFSRIPVYGQDVDDITGYVHIRDLLNAKEELQLKDIKNKMIHVSSEKIIQELFLDMQKKRAHIAVVVDEYGGTAGIITMEDILEELVGEILDETDELERDIKRIGKKAFIINGDADLDEVNSKTGLSLGARGAYTTIGGYIQYKLKDIPEEGKKIKFKRAIIEILKVSDKKVEKVKIKII